MRLYLLYLLLILYTFLDFSFYVFSVITVIHDSLNKKITLQIYLLRFKVPTYLPINCPCYVSLIP